VATTDQAVTGVAGRYANALFDLATEEKSVAKTGEGLASFGAMIEGSADLQRLISSPTFSVEDHVSAIESLAAKAKINGLALNLPPFLVPLRVSRRWLPRPGVKSRQKSLQPKR
jgi:F-type H+-transporting ATPase subunit delta